MQKNKIMIKTFKIVSFLEGLSYLLLLFVGVPMKYYANNDIMVKLMGMPHGLLFVAYIIIAILIKTQMKWDLKTMFIVLIASVLPFGTFYVVKKYV